MLALDHLTIVAPTLAEGVAHVRRCIDIDVPFGQRHDYMGSHNHLLQLGNSVYLEIVALDPGRAPPGRAPPAAAPAAALQGRFHDYGRGLFTHQERLEREDLLDDADALGLDLDRFAADLDDAEVARRVQDDADDADLMDLLSTPTFFVNGRRHIGPYDVESLLAALRRAT